MLSISTQHIRTSPVPYSLKLHDFDTSNHRLPGRVTLLKGWPDVDLNLTETLTDRLTAPILTVKNGIKFIKEGHAIF